VSASDPAPGAWAPRVRFVVVAWGRSEGLERGLEAIAAVAAAGVDTETVVVLRPGDDDAAALARARRARVIEPEPGAPFTPGANRNRGAAGAAAPYLAFVDGDAVIEPSFVVAALERLDAEPALGGVGGRIHERQWEDGALVREIADSYRSGSGGPVEMLATAWIARRAWFEAVGGFDTRLPAEEDVELCIRLADAGHPVVALDRRAAYHDGPPRPSLAELRRRWATGLYAGQGLLLRYSWGTPHFVRHFGRQGLYFAALGFALLGAFLALATVLGVRKAPGTFRDWLTLAFLVVVIMAVRKRSLAHGALAVLTWIVLGLGIVRAWIAGPRPPETVG
jgi:cellulose synthase/poly-beta-1,6-N-acetylglucosamine synthase-like glycosyltransferase